MVQDAKAVVRTFFAALKDKDFSTLRSVLADDVTFLSPRGQAENADGFLQTIKGFSPIITDIIVHAMAVDGADVLTWYELHTTIAPPTPVANWSHVEGDKIIRAKVTFDPRVFIVASGK